VAFQLPSGCAETQTKSIGKNAEREARSAPPEDHSQVLPEELPRDPRERRIPVTREITLLKSLGNKTPQKPWARDLAYLSDAYGNWWKNLKEMLNKSKFVIPAKAGIHENQ
jgi:hypothetical protein